MQYGFLRCAAFSPALRVADCDYNADQIIAAMRQAAGQGVQLLCLPELCLTGYTCSDLFLQQTLYQGAEAALARILAESRSCPLVVLVGLPVCQGGKLYNCAAVVAGGRLLGLVPKRHLPNYGEFYEHRHFAPGPRQRVAVTVAAQSTRMGSDQLFVCAEMPVLVLGVEICEDLWAPVPPSCAHALAGATLVCHVSASDETVVQAD